MIDATWIGEALFLEIVFAASFIAGFAVFLVLRSHRRDKRAAHSLANKIRTEQNSRRKDIEKLVEKIIHEDKSTAEALVAGIVRAEQDLYQAFLESYILRTNDSVDRLHSNVSEFTQSYKTLFSHSRLAPSNTESNAAKSAQGNAQSDEPAESKSPKEYEELIKILETKLEVSDQALNHVFREYAAMFGMGVNAKSKLTPEEIMERLQSGDLG